jgi:hypothetical protein
MLVLFVPFIKYLGFEAFRNEFNCLCFWLLASNTFPSIKIFIQEVKEEEEVYEKKK